MRTRTLAQKRVRATCSSLGLSSRNFPPKAAMDAPIWGPPPGTWVEVYWPVDSKYYKAEVVGFNARNEKHELL